MTRERCKEIAARIIAQTKTEETFVAISGMDSAAATFSANALMPPLATADAAVQLSVRDGNRYATVAGNRVDDDGLAALLERVTETVRELPELQTTIPYPGPVEVRPSDIERFGDRDAAFAWCVSSAREVIAAAGRAGMLATGKISVSNMSTAVADSAGLFLYQPSSLAHVLVHILAADGTSSGYTETRARAASELDTGALVARAIDACAAWKNPVELAPGRWTTVFEPQAVADMLVLFLRQFDQQAIDENRSALRKLDGTSRVGSELFPNAVSLYSDPHDASVPSMPFTLDGQPLTRTDWVRAGVIESITRSRYDALKSGRPALPFPSNLLMRGGTDSLDAIIASTKRGLLVKGFAALEIEDPTNCLLTGSTKDGLFLIENGRITKAVRNMMFRETPVYLLKQFDVLGAPVPVHPRGMYFPMSIPPMRVTDVLYGAPSGIV